MTYASSKAVCLGISKDVGHDFGPLMLLISQMGTLARLLPLIFSLCNIGRLVTSEECENEVRVVKYGSVG